MMRITRKSKRRLWKPGPPSPKPKRHSTPRDRLRPAPSEERNPMIDETDDILDDLFHGCAFAAYIDQAIEQQGWPDSEATKRRAYRYYEMLWDKRRDI